MQQNKTLVSICVLAYNSQETIGDTLNSIYNQTYKSIELIIADDGSKDKTVELSQKWLKTYGDRFLKSSILTVDSNTGTPANCNRAISVSRGEWIKLIAADDCLMPNFVEDNINYIQENSRVRILYSNYYCFKTDAHGNKNIVEQRLSKEANTLFDTDPKKQLKLYLGKCYNISPTAFIQKSLIHEVGGFIEKYNVFEDTPFFTKVLLANNKIYHLNKTTCLYRLDTNSTTRDISRRIFYKTIFFDNNLEFKKDMVYPLHHWYEINYWISEYSFRLQYRFTIKVLKNRRTPINNIVYLVVKALNPYYLISKLLS